MHFFCRLVAIAASCLFYLPAYAIDSAPKERWEEHSELVQSAQAIDPLGSDLFGESADYYRGGLSFSHTDISIPGNSSLPVALTRTYSVTDSRSKRARDLPLADWDLSLPYISGVYAKQTGWVRQTEGVNAGPGEERCAVTTSGEAIPPVVGVHPEHFNAHDYWNGITLSLPGGGGGELLLASESDVPSPSGNWYWVTDSFTYLGCLDELEEGDGQGFKALTASGITYYFDRMATFYNPAVVKRGEDASGAPYISTLERREFRLYATRVEDRFGNSVSFNYTNLPDEPIQLTEIKSNDHEGNERAITLTYNANGHIATATKHGRVWEYKYREVDDRKTLSEVVRPDESTWEIDFGQLSTMNMKPLPLDPGEANSCLVPREVEESSATGTLSHPSGAEGVFRLEPQRFGRTNVPLVCTEVGGPNPDPYQGDSVYPVTFYSPALMQKEITGSGLTSKTWTYSYASDYGFEGTSGTTRATIMGPGGEWTRYVYGNVYHGNEGLRLKAEYGSGPGSILRVDEFDYQIDPSSENYPDLIGTGISPHGASYPSRVLRPATSRMRSQDDVEFFWQASDFDQFGRSREVIRAMVPAHSDPLAPPSSRT
jgi:hypothetical protein